ncbi:MAG: archaellin/type IV pilin N-terminal domain-containing protein [Candidatus Woesearchaeota archaeon]
MRKRMGKKGVSPIIAVVLLIAIVVGLGAVLMTISRSFMTETEENIGEKTEQMKCSTDVQIELVDKVEETTPGTVYTFTIETGPYIDIDELIVTGIGSTDVLTATTDFTPLAKGRIGQYTATFASSIGTMEMLKIVPAFNGDDGVSIPCPQAGIEVNYNEMSTTTSTT